MQEKWSEEVKREEQWGEKEIAWGRRNEARLWLHSAEPKKGGERERGIKNAKEMNGQEELGQAE